MSDTMTRPPTPPGEPMVCPWCKEPLSPGDLLLARTLGLAPCRPCLTLPPR